MTVHNWRHDSLPLETWQFTTQDICQLETGGKDSSQTGNNARHNWDVATGEKAYHNWGQDQIIIFSVCTRFLETFQSKIHQLSHTFKTIFPKLNDQISPIPLKFIPCDACIFPSEANPITTRTENLPQETHKHCLEFYKTTRLRIACSLTTRPTSVLPAV